MFPTPHAVTIHPFDSTQRDRYNNAVPGFGPDRVERVYGWAPATVGTRGTEPYEPNRTAVVFDLDLYAPPAFSVGPNDEMTVNGRRYEVVGTPEDFNHGPFGFTPGVRVSLKRVEEAG